MAQGVSSHLNRSGSGYERSRPQCQSLVPIEWALRDGRAGFSTQGQSTEKRKTLQQFLFAVMFLKRC